MEKDSSSLKELEKSLRDWNTINSQEEFDEYLLSLLPNQKCRFSAGIPGVIELCNNSFKCRFAGNDEFTMQGIKKFECTRTRYLKLSKLM